MKSPSFQFYAQDFLTGVTYLTNEEIGMYIKMLAKQWTDGKIPKKRLGFLVGIDWENFSEELKSKFIDKGEYLINIRLEQERDKKEIFLEKQRKNGSKGGRPRKNKENEKPKQNPNESQKKPLEDENEKEEEIEKEKKGGVGEKNSNEHFLSIEELKSQSKNEFTWRETIIRNFREPIPNFSEDDFNHYLEQFFKQLENDGETEKTLAEFKKHFSRWLNIQIERNNGSKKSSNNSTEYIAGRQTEDDLRKNLTDWKLD